MYYLLCNTILCINENKEDNNISYNDWKSIRDLEPKALLYVVDILLIFHGEIL